MNDAGQTVRKGFFNALTGAIAIPGDPINKVPIVDEKLDLNITEHDIYMLIGGQAATGADTKQTWGKEVDLNITIVNRRKATNSKTIIEDIANDMLQILFPTKTTFGLSVSTPFNLTYVKYISDSYSFEKLVDGWQISKAMIFKTRITQTS
jgi:hypothetical protein